MQQARTNIANSSRYILNDDDDTTQLRYSNESENNSWEGDVKDIVILSISGDIDIEEYLFL